MKAFFSYSTQDADVVSAVATHVGRPFVHIDRYSFGAADELVEAMEKAVEESSVFVLFVSRSSNQSAWVNFELGEARYHHALRRIKRVVVVLLDSRLTAEDVPSWMRRYVFVRSRSPRPIARAIRSVIDELVQDEQGKMFVGRARETAALQSALVPPDTFTSTSFVVLTGLPGIGRRTLLTRVAGDSISINRLLKVEVEEGDSIQDLTTKLADLVEDVIFPADSMRIAGEIQNLADRAALIRFVEDAEKAARLHELIVLYDAGGLLNGQGAPTGAVRLLLNELQQRHDIFIALLTNRRPVWRFTPELDEIPVVNVAPLSEVEVRQLVALQARSRDLRLTRDHIDALAEQARGYPPAVNVAIRMTESYGVELAIRPSAQISAYSPRPLSRYLRSLRHDSVERAVLQILSGNSPLPIQLVEQVVDASPDQTREALASLIDTSLVVPDGSNGWYRISEPVVEYVEREYSGCTKDQYQRVADALKEFLRNDQNERSYFELERVRFRSLMLSGHDRQQSEAMSLAADWIRLAERFYHRREYLKSLEIARAASVARPTVPQPIIWVAKSQVKLGNYADAIVSIESLISHGQLREADFLRGFLERSRGRHRDAVRYYERALTEGYGGLAIHRDLAECYLHMKNIEKASQHIEIAQSRQTDNRYVVDLRIKILCLQGRESEARQLLKLLEEIDEPAFAAHRRSRLEYAFNNLEAAYLAAVQASSYAERAPFEVLANLALCEIRTSRLADAGDTLDRIRNLYGSIKKDVQTGLRARRAITEQEYEEALRLCHSFEVPDNPIHLALEREALLGVLHAGSIRGDKRDQYNKRVQAITSQLESRFGGVAWDVEPD